MEANFGTRTYPLLFSQRTRRVRPSAEPASSRQSETIAEAGAPTIRATEAGVAADCAAEAWPLAVVGDLNFVTVSAAIYCAIRTHPGRSQFSVAERGPHGRVLPRDEGVPPLRATEGYHVAAVIVVLPSQAA